MKTTPTLLQKILDYIVIFLIIFLPWSTFISVFLMYGIGIPGVNFIKEIALFSGILVLCALFWEKYKKTGKNPIKIYWFVWVILAYMLVMSVVTIFTTGVRGLIFGGRYDFIFLIVFLFALYGREFLLKPLSYYIKIFLISAGAMLFVSGLLKFPLNEELLLFFGYSGNASAWDFSGAPPIFHGIDGASVRRFQGLLDGPNTMGAFLILFSGLLIYQIRRYKDWYFVVGLGMIVIILMVIYTHSRSALIGFVGGSVVALAGGLGFLYKNYKKQLIAMAFILMAFVWAVGLKYSGNSEALLGREGSTKGHKERMIVGFERFMSAPMGQGMGSSGPAYRHVLKLHEASRAEVEERDRFYIPESWYIQQFIE